jgi:acyl-CoA synthetase (AMP-forming)/AMP-acid ligase II
MPTLDSTSKLLLPLFLPIFVLDLILSLLSKLLSLLSKLLSPQEDATKELQSVEVGKGTEMHGAPRRHPATQEGELFTVYNNITTVYEMIERTKDRFGDRVAMQHFEFLGLKKVKESDQFPTKQFGDTMIQVTYNELGKKIRAFGEGLRQMGMEPQPKVDNFDDAKGKFTLVIFEDTCKEWTTAFQGAMSQSMVVATCYATLGHEAVVAAVNETQATALMVNWKQVEDFYKRAKDMPSLATIIASTNEMPTDATIWSPADDKKSKVQVVSYDDVMENGNANSNEPTPPKVCII